jgi:hypothetical protein
MEMGSMSRLIYMILHALFKIKEMEFYRRYKSFHNFSGLKLEEMSVLAPLMGESTALYLSSHFSNEKRKK